jgi:hypothetical protein
MIDNSSIFECVLNILSGNLNLKSCSKRKLRKHKSKLGNIADIHLPLSDKEIHNSARRISVAAVISCTACNSELNFPFELKYVR